MLLSAYQPLPQKELDIGQNLCFPLQFLFILMNNIPYDKTFTPISDMETSDYFEPNKLENKYKPKKGKAKVCNLLILLVYFSMSVQSVE